MATYSPKKLTCKIVNIEKDPTRPTRTIVSVQFDDGTKAGPWVQGFSLAPERPISLEEFKVQLRNFEIERPIDPLKYLRDATDEVFELELPENIAEVE